MRRRLGIALAVGLVLRLLMAASERSVPVDGDAAEYAAIAKNIAAGGGFALKSGVPTASRPPIYPAFLTLFSPGVSDSWPAARFAQAFVDTGTIWLVYAFGLLTFRNESYAFAGALLYALHPVFIGYSAQILTEPIFLPAWLATVCLWLKTLDEESPGWAILAGLATGLAIMTRPNFIFFPPGAAVMLAAIHKLRVRPIACLVVILVCAYVSLLPWSMRNKRAMGAW
ncbi:MAG: glycosyltransferase family 39 protein, partial [Elusimicrobia bacterium]|nr:glycosyltransferase family 39 protein [Elusimicrobiota bacterium]